MCDLIHLGDHCAPGIIINDILLRNEKLLFMLGVYSFDSIIKYLEFENLELIYDKQFLQVNNKNIARFENKIKSFSHSSGVHHSKFGFGFNHDYKYCIKNNAVLNYNFIVNIFNEKIANTKKLFSNENPIIFITFTHFTSNIDDMICILQKYIPSKKFYIIFFTNNDEFTYSPKKQNNYDTVINEDTGTSEQIDSSEKVFIIKLQNSYDNWFLMKKQQALILYKEIYESFYATAIKINLHMHFPTFENTPGYKNYK